MLINSWDQTNKEAYSNAAAIRAFSYHKGLKPAEKLVFDRYSSAPGKIIDLGCGTGRTSVCLLERGFQVEAVDYSPAMIAAARKEHPNLSIRFSVMDVRHLEFADNSFDYAFFSFNGLDCLYPISQRIEAIKEIKRVLVPGGRFIFSSHNSLFFYRTWPKIKRLLYSVFCGKIHPYRVEPSEHGDLLLFFTSPPSQKRQLTKLGFTDIEIITTVSKYWLKAIFFDPFPTYVCRKSTIK